MTSLLALTLPIANPTWIFFVVLLIILLAPLLFERLHIPQLVGMILAGIAVGSLLSDCCRSCCRLSSEAWWHTN